jgi:hypothetical protein
MNSLVVSCGFKYRSYKLAPLRADVMWWLQKNDFEELWLELQIDQGHGATRVPTGINEVDEFIISIAVPGIICKRVQFG